MADYTIPPNILFDLPFSGNNVEFSMKNTTVEYITRCARRVMQHGGLWPWVAFLVLHLSCEESLEHLEAVIMI